MSSPQMMRMFGRSAMDPSWIAPEPVGRPADERRSAWDRGPHPPRGKEPVGARDAPDAGGAPAAAHPRRTRHDRASGWKVVASRSGRSTHTESRRDMTHYADKTTTTPSGVGRNPYPPASPWVGWIAF